MNKGTGFIIEEHYKISVSRGELRTLVKAIQCLELYEGQGPDITPDQITPNERQFLRGVRSMLDDLAKENFLTSFDELD